MSKYRISPHKTQLLVWQSTRRFKLIRAGRRWGKTDYAVDSLIAAGLVAERGVGYYVAPTFKQAKDIAWNTFKLKLVGTGAKFIENTGEITLPNGIQIRLKGADDPDTLRGVALFKVVLDEYQDMKPEVLDVIIRPALLDLEGDVVVIFTPKGYNHAYELEQRVKDNPRWSCFHFETGDNPFIPKEDLALTKAEMSTFFWEQEHLALYKISDSDLFKEAWFRTSKEPMTEGIYVSAVDLSGFTDYAVAMKQPNPDARLDQTAQAIVKCYGNEQWWVKNVDAWRSSQAQSIDRIIKNAWDSRCLNLGIEKGPIFTAIYGPLVSRMRALGKVIALKDVTHGNTNKMLRIMGAVQGALEHGKITFNDGPYLQTLKEQFLAIPNKGVKDDMADVLAMVRQVAPFGNFINASDMLQDRFENDSIDTDW